MKIFYFIIILLSSYNLSFPQWILQNSGTTGNLYSISGINENLLFIAAQNNILLKTTNGGTNWIASTISITGTAGTCYFLDENTGWIGGRRIYKTTNGGINWVLQYFIDTTHYFNCFSFLNNLTGWVSDSRNIWPPSGGIYATTNGGTNWVYKISTSDFFHHIQFVNNQTGYSCGYTSFYKTTNAGTNWTSSTLAPGYKLFFVSADTGWVGYNQIIRTTNAGLNWVIQLSGSPSGISGIKFPNNSTGYAINYTYVYKTTNSGVIWNSVYNNPSCRFNGLYFYNAITGWIISDYGLIYKTVSGGIVNISNEESANPREYCLYQNFPNPFNSETVISFDIPAASRIKISVFDIAGNEIDVLADENAGPGSYSKTWNAGMHSSGIYYYRITAGNFTDTKKMALIK